MSLRNVCGAMFLGSALLTSGSPPEPASEQERNIPPQTCGKSILQEGRYQNIGAVDITPKSSHAAIFYRFFLEDRENQEPVAELTVERRRTEDYPKQPGEKTRITWLGHSAMLIETGGLRILTDPNFSQRASPISWAGPKRFAPPPISVEELPDLDAVLISHDHYDHLDYDTIMALMGKTARFVAPMGVGERIIMWGVEKDKVTQLDWWGEFALSDDMTLALTPAQHFSARGIFDRNKTLWGSWVIAGPESRVFFSGDTGMFDCFKDIGERYGPFDF
ncbi:MAG: MBL fold metallo-hydrolase, partial [Nitrospinota bacterium]|nr:MBL fold metallo-hydrolase [Nitrospinota bacterium]